MMLGPLNVCVGKYVCFWALTLQWQKRTENQLLSQTANCGSAAVANYANKSQLEMISVALL